MAAAAFKTRHSRVHIAIFVVLTVLLLLALQPSLIRRNNAISKRPVTDFYTVITESVPIEKQTGALSTESDVHNSKLAPTDDEMMTYDLDYIPEDIALQHPVCEDYGLVADLENSRLSLLNPVRRTYSLGDTITVSIQLHDAHGTPISTGGADIRPRMYDVKRNAYATAPITDHGNGTYTAKFEALWVGQSTIKAKIAYTPEAIRTIYFYRKKLGRTLDIEAVFSVGSINETTLCHPTKEALIGANYSKICNLTWDNSGMPWFCGKPKDVHLLCEDWTDNHYLAASPELLMTDCEWRLLNRSGQDMRESLEVNVEEGSKRGSQIIELPTNPCTGFNITALWTLRQPTGFMYENKWYLRHCKDLVSNSLDPDETPSYSASHPDPSCLNILSHSGVGSEWVNTSLLPQQGLETSNVLSCLRNKQLLLFGDSTARNWYGHFEYLWNCTSVTEKWAIAKWHKRTECVNTEHNFTVQWLPHSQPFLGADVNRYTRTSIARHLDETGSEERVIALIHLYAHVVPFHHDVFRNKIRRIRTSVENILNRNMYIKVLIKGFHTFYNAQPRFSDYYGKVYKHIVYEEFAGLHNRVIFLEQKDMTDALGIRDNHPPESVISAMIDQMLSYICD